MQKNVQKAVRLPENVWYELKSQSALAGMTIGDYLTRLVALHQRPASDKSEVTKRPGDLL